MPFNLQTLTAFFIGITLSSLVYWVIMRRWLAFNQQKTVDQIKIAQQEIRIQIQDEHSREYLEFQKKKSKEEQVLDKLRMDLELREKELQKYQKWIHSKQKFIEEKSLEIDRNEAEVKRKKYNLENLRQSCRRRRRLLQITHMTHEQAKEMVKQEIEEECEEEFRVLRHSLLERSEEDINMEAQRLVIDTMQRLSSMPSTDITASVVKLPNDDMKGRIIGREGRNIRSFETATGTNLVIDETPETVMVSSFDPVKRDIARIALENLVKDGRIHPAHIEEFVEQAEAKIQENIFQLGQRAIEKLGLTGIPTEVLHYIGKLNYRLSNNQNTLEHCIEVGLLMSMLASELGLDPKKAKRCAILHDIGKAMPADTEGSHALAAARLLKKHGEDPIVVNAVAAHHEEVPAESAYAPLLMLADAISARRPGARSESLDGYVQRIKALEDLARSFGGITDVYAVQAGREVRVIVSPSSYEDLEAKRLAWRISRKIEQDIDYPGNIKVTIIREQRYTETATQVDL